MAANQIIFELFNSLAGVSNFFDGLVIFFASHLGWILILIVLIYYIFRRDFREIPRITFIVASSLTAWIVAQAIKALVSAPRPFLVLDDVTQLISHGGIDAFPSGHATIYMALGLAFYVYNKKFGTIIMIGALLIGLARIIAGIHWPVDILGGYILAGIVVFLIYYIIRGRTTERSLT